MYFKVDFAVRRLMLDQGASLEFSFAGAHPLSLQLRTPTRDEQDNKYAPEDALGTALTQREPNAKVRAMFERLAEGERLPDSDLDAAHVTAGDDELSQFVPDRSASPDVLSQPFQSFASDVTNELWDCVRRTVCVVRWRMRSGGPHNPFISLGSYWSFNGTDWKVLPLRGRVYASDTPLISSLAAAEHEEIRELVQAGRTEPLGHELYREAWEQRFANPRSALILGIAAAEAGFKQLVAALVPAARWLAENAPTPPLVNMLEQYLPLLPAKNTMGGKVLPPPPTVINTLKKGVRLRNEIIHRGFTKLEQETLIEVLSAVRDVLWMLDYYAGFDWALQYVSYETGQALRA